MPNDIQVDYEALKAFVSSSDDAAALWLQVPVDGLSAWTDSGLPVFIGSGNNGVGALRTALSAAHRSASETKSDWHNQLLVMGLDIAAVSATYRNADAEAAQRATAAQVLKSSQSILSTNETIRRQNAGVEEDNERVRRENDRLLAKDGMAEKNAEVVQGNREIEKNNAEVATANAAAEKANKAAQEANATLPAA